MGYILQVMPESPQPHRIEQAAKLLTKGQLAAVSTDTGFSLVCRLDDKEALDKIRLIRQLSEKKHFTLFCDSLSQMSKPSLASTIPATAWQKASRRGHTPSFWKRLKKCPVAFLIRLRRPSV